MVFNSVKTAGNWELNETKLLNDISSYRKFQVQEKLNTTQKNMPLLRQISTERCLLISYASLLLEEYNREESPLR